MSFQLERLLYKSFRLLAAEAESDGEHHSSFGVHVTFNDIYYAVLFLAAIYVGGQIASRLLRMPDLVGEIFTGILLGPNLIEDFVPNPPAWVLFGEIGLVLLVLEAGIDIDMDTLKLIGARGFIIAVFGSLLPIGIGIALAIAIGTDTKGAIAAGAAFGPTSLGIALNILRSGGILNTPVGQLIISAAVIDDMIALVVLSLLRTLTTEITVASILVPIISALGFLLIGGYIAIFWMPALMHKFVLSHVEERNHARVELTTMMALLLGLMPATFYAQASFLMGAFIAGLAFCRSHGLHTLFVSQFKRVLQWLMRIFFAASIGFQVPIKDFGNGQVIWQGLLFTVALTGKIAVGFMVPNFTQDRKFTGVHLRDCLLTGFSMAAEGEFAFVIAVFAVDAGLIDRVLYSSVVLAVLLSTIVPPFCLRYTINRYNKIAEKRIQQAAADELQRFEDLSKRGEGRESQLLEEIISHSTIFLCIQTQSEARWGLMNNLMGGMQKLGLEVIDHRSWHPRGVNTTLVNEIYAKDKLDKTLMEEGDPEEVIANRIEQVREKLLSSINQPGIAKVRVQRWFPGVVEELVEEVEEKVTKKHIRDSNVSIESRLLTEATSALEKKRQRQIEATKEKTVEELMQEAGGSANKLPETPESERRLSGVAEDQVLVEGLPAAPDVSRPKPRRRLRQKMRSTPVVGGGLFEDSMLGTQKTGLDIVREEKKLEEEEEKKEEQKAEEPRPVVGDVESQTEPAATTDDLQQPKPPPPPRRMPRRKMLSVPVRAGGGLFGPTEPSDEETKTALDSFRRQHKERTGRDSFFNPKLGPSGIPAELTVQGETFRIRISEETLENLRKGYSGDVLYNRSMNLQGVTMNTEDSPVVNMLHGYVRAAPTLGKIKEESVSEVGSEFSEDDIDKDLAGPD